MLTTLMAMLIEHVLIPLLAAIVGGVIGVLVSLAGIRYVEWFRRLPRWEPYAQSLWSIQVEVMRSVVQQTGLVYNAAFGRVTNASNRERFSHYGHELVVALDPLMVNGERLLILKLEFNQAVSDFVGEALKATVADTTGALPADYTEKLWTMQQLIVGMAQKELGVGVLHSRTSTAVQDAREYQDLLKGFEAVKSQSTMSAEDKTSSESTPDPLS